MVKHDRKDTPENVSHPENALIERMERLEAGLARIAELLDLQPQAPAASDLLTRAEIEAHFKISRTTFWQWRRHGDFPPPVEVGGRPRWTRASVEAFISSMEGR